MDVVTLNQIKKLRETQGVSNIKEDFAIGIDNLLLNLDGFDNIGQGDYTTDYFRVAPVTSLLAGLSLGSYYRIYPDYINKKIALVGYISGNSTYTVATIDMATKKVLDVKSLLESSWPNYQYTFNSASTSKNGVILGDKFYCFIDLKRCIVYDMVTFELVIKTVPGLMAMGRYQYGIHMVIDSINKKAYLLGGTVSTGTSVYPSELGIYEWDIEAFTFTLISQSRILMSMFCNGWDTTYSNYGYYSGVTFNEVTGYIEGIYKGNLYQFNVTTKAFITRTRQQLMINEPSIMEFMSKVSERGKVRLITSLATPDAENATNLDQAKPNVDVFDMEYCPLSCDCYLSQPLFFELTDEVEIDLIKINLGASNNPSYATGVTIYAYDAAKNTVASFSPSSSDYGPYLWPSWYQNQIHTKVKYIEIRNNNSYVINIQGIQLYKGFKSYYATDADPTTYQNNSPGNNGIYSQVSNARKHYMEFANPVKLDYILAFSDSYSNQQNTRNPYYMKVEASNDIAGPWTTVLNPTSDNNTVSNRYKFPLSTGGVSYKFYRVYTTTTASYFYFLPVKGTTFDWNGVDESVTYYNANNNGYYQNMAALMAALVFGSNTSLSTLVVTKYNSSSVVVNQQYWMEFPLKPIPDAKYILMGGVSNLATQLANTFRIQTKKSGITSYQNISLKDGVAIPVNFLNYQLGAPKNYSTLYMYELTEAIDIDSVRIESIPIDQSQLTAYPIRFATNRDVADALGSSINITIQTTRDWFDYFNPQFDASQDLANDAYMHTPDYLYRFIYNKNKLIKISKSTGMATEVIAYTNYKGIKAPLKPLLGDPTKYIISEQFEGLFTYGLKVYDTTTDIPITLLLPTTANLLVNGAVQCYVDEVDEAAYFLLYADATNQLIQMNFRDDMGIELEGDSFAYIKATLATILSLTLNRGDGTSLYTTFSMAVGQTLYLVFRNGGKISIQSGKISALWGEKA